MKSSSALHLTGRLWPAVSGWVAGAALQLQQGQLWGAPLYLALALGAVVLLCLCWGRRCGWGLALACAGLAFAVTGTRAEVMQRSALSSVLEGQDIVVQGVVAALPQVNDTGVRFRLQTEGAWVAGQPVEVPALIQLGWYSGIGVDFDAGNWMADLQLQPADLRAGERWSMTVRLKAPHGQLNPFGLDAELWLWEQGIQAVGYVRAGHRDAPPARWGQTWLHPVEWARQAVRERIYAAVPQRQQAALLAALVVGDQNALERSEWDIFRRTGVAHLVSISGLHITMFAWGAMAVVGALWRRSSRLCLHWSAPAAAWVGGVTLAALYAVFSGWGVPAQRTVWMLATVGLLRLSGRRWPWPLVWASAMALIVALDPWALMQAGFWLSFVAVAVLFATDLGAPVGAAGRSSLRQRFTAALREQWVLTLALSPLTLLLFHQVSLVGLMANAFAIPWVTLVLTPLAMLGVLWAPMWQAAAVAARGFISALQELAAWPWASMGVPAAPAWVAVPAMCGALWLAMPWPWRVRALGVVWLWPLLSWQNPRPQPGQFELWAPDVGQGNAVLLRTATHSLLYDTGPRWGRESDAGHRVLAPWLQAMQEPVDTLVLSHRDSDHTGGAAAVFEHAPDARVLGSMDAGQLPAVGHNVERCVAGQRWLWDGVSFEVLHPTLADYDRSQRSNAMSCVLRVGNGQRSVLLAGDIEAPQEARLLDQAQALRADVLLVPHHGSKTSSSPGFLDAVAPSLALVQSGYRNRFGHPAAAVMERYQARGIRVLTSPECGALQWGSSAPQTWLCERQQARRYWHHALQSVAAGEDR